MVGIAVSDWDIDGLASGSIFKDLGLIEEIIIPPIGEYWLSDLIMDVVSEYDEIYFLDYIPSKRTLDALSWKSRIYIFDHSFYCPANSKNIKSYCRESPSTTFLLMEYFNLDPDIKILLGLVNDLGSFFSRYREFEIFIPVIEENNIDLDELVDLIKLLNSPLYFSDIPLLYENLLIIEQNTISKNYIKSLDKRIKYIEMLENIISSLLENVKVCDKYSYLEYKGDLYLIRKLPVAVYRKTGYPSIIIDSGFFTDYFQIASYCPTCDFRDLIINLRDEGFVAGGSESFVGIVIDKSEDIETFLDKIKYELSKGFHGSSG